MAHCDFSFLTTDCPPDFGELQTELEALCDLVEVGVIPIDPLDGLCGEWGADSTIFNLTFDDVTRELALTAAPAWGSIVAAQFVSTTFAPLDISLVASYAGPTMVVNIINPSACRSLTFYGNFTLGNIVTYTDSCHVLLELRDVTGGLPGVVIGDWQRRLTGFSSGGFLFDEPIFNVPFTLTLAPSGSFLATFQTFANTIVAASDPAGKPTLWHQTNLNFDGIGALV